MITIVVNGTTLSGLDVIQRPGSCAVAFASSRSSRQGTEEGMAKATESSVHTVVPKPFTPAELAEGIVRAAEET